MCETESLHLLIVAVQTANVPGMVRDLYNDLLEADYGIRLDDAALRGLVEERWRGTYSAADGARVWRLSLRFDASGGEPPEAFLAFVQRVANAAVDLAKQEDSGVRAVVKLQDPAQLRGHSGLYREVYILEMALRDVVSYVFAAHYPENLTNGLEKTRVKPVGRASLPQEAQLVRCGENQFFYILFDKYAVLNDPPDIQAGHIVEAIRGGTNIDEVRELLDLRPIRNERHAAFLAGLRELMDPLERLRNGVAHNRTVPDTVRENFFEAAKKLRAHIDEFWAREAVHVEVADSPVGNTGVAPTEDR